MIMYSYIYLALRRSEPMHKVEKSSGPKASLNVWAKLADDDDDDEDEEEEVVEAKKPEVKKSPKKPAGPTAAEVAAAKAKADEAALDAAIAEVKATEKEEKKPKAIDDRFAGKVRSVSETKRRKISCPDKELLLLVYFSRVNTILH